MSRKICFIIFGNTDFGSRHFDYINESLRALEAVDFTGSVTLCLKLHNPIPPREKYRYPNTLRIFREPDGLELMETIAAETRARILVKIHQPRHTVDPEILELFLHGLPQGNHWVYSMPHAEENFAGFGLSAVPVSALPGLLYSDYRKPFDHLEKSLSRFFFSLPESFTTDRRLEYCFMESRLLPPLETKLYLDTHLGEFLKRRPYANFNVKCLPEGAYSALSNMLEKMDNLSLKNLEILELGPGRTLIQQILILLLGAGKVASVDIDETPLRFAPTFYVELLHFLAKERVSIPELDVIPNIERIRKLLEIITFGEDISFNPQRLDFRCPASAERLPFGDASFDFAYSNAAFEHFSDPEKAVYELYRTLRPGAGAYIHIDLKDHDTRFSKSAPLEFLKTSPEEWQRIISDPNCGCYFTRYRAPQYLDWFEKAGFNLLRIEKTLYEGDIASQRKEFADDMHPFSNDELSILEMILILRK